MHLWGTDNQQQSVKKRKRTLCLRAGASEKYGRPLMVDVLLSLFGLLIGNEGGDAFNIYSEAFLSPQTWGQRNDIRSYLFNLRSWRAVLFWRNRIADGSA
ncbi:hypothetical protein NPIL_542651 [Nephila pilipes]|uniref:Uncharacterized protein n=1 Tax=Nephila pilipes TaxID=299642 RepID=A0A8X6U6I5_NEPPI|nr:hypothetical protein NPIL_542651 [Nephila pilipes]